MKRSSSGVNRKSMLAIERVDADAFAAAGCAGDEQMRHLREIGDDRLPVNILAEGERDFRSRLRFFPICRLQQLAQRHFHFATVCQLDPDRVLAGNRRENVDPLRARGARQVALEADDLVHPHAFRGINFVAGDGRTFRDIAGRDRDSELGQGFDQGLLNLAPARPDRRPPALPDRVRRANRDRAACNSPRPMFDSLGRPRDFAFLFCAAQFRQRRFFRRRRFVRQRGGVDDFRLRPIRPVLPA